ncbi:MAG: hypothetical protein Q7W02_02265 [Candidatus Rokubacteria bacterium]|nr:hypothetical protein [Candidatus Rokubacteria bacterium]
MAKKKAKARRRRKLSRPGSRIEKLLLAREKERAGWAPFGRAISEAASKADLHRAVLESDFVAGMNALATRQAAREARGHPRASRRPGTSGPQKAGRRAEITPEEFGLYAKTHPITSYGQPGGIGDKEHAKQLSAILRRPLTRQQFRGARLRKKHPTV